MTSSVGYFQSVEPSTRLHTYSNSFPVPVAHTSVDLNVCGALCSFWPDTHGRVRVFLSSNLHTYWTLVGVRCALAYVCPRPRLRQRVYFSMGRPNTIKSRHTQDSVRDHRIAITHKETAQPTTDASERASGAKSKSNSYIQSDYVLRLWTHWAVKRKKQKTERTTP